MARPERHNCLFCGGMFQADPRNARHQKYCSNRTAARRARRPVSAPGWPKRRTRTTSADPRMWRGCSCGERPIRGTGGERKAKAGTGRGRPLRYKISAPRKPLK